MTTDQGANIKKAIELYRHTEKISWLPCSSHKLQLCVYKALSECKGAKMLIDKCHKLSTFFRTTSNAMNILNEEQDKLYKSRLKLLSTTVTRWNSQYEMARRVYQINTAINATIDRLKSGAIPDGGLRAKDLGSLPLSDSEIAALRETLVLMKPLADLTHWAGQTENPTISQIYPRIQEMLSAPHNEVSAQAQELRQSLDRLLKDGWSLESIPDVVLIAMFLNPACLSQGVLGPVVPGSSGGLRNKAKALVRDAVMSFLQSESKEPDQTSQAGEEDSTFWIIRAVYVTDAYDTRTKGDHKQYMDRPHIFWKERGTGQSTHEMAAIARSYLCVQATSSESERLFSKAGQVLSARKTNISDRAFSNIVYFSSFDKLKRLSGWRDE